MQPHACCPGQFWAGGRWLGAGLWPGGPKPGTKLQWCLLMSQLFKAQFQTPGGSREQLEGRSTCMCTRMCACTCMCVCMCVGVCVCARACMWVCLHVDAFLAGGPACECAPGVCLQSMGGGEGRVLPGPHLTDPPISLCHGSPFTHEDVGTQRGRASGFFKVAVAELGSGPPAART